MAYQKSATASRKVFKKIEVASKQPASKVTVAHAPANTAPKRVKQIVGIGDLHCGSSVGLCPPGYRLKTGGIYGLNPFQEVLWESYLTCLSWLDDSLPKDSPTLLVVNGDVVDGNHHGNMDLVSGNEFDHIDIAEQVLDPLISRFDKVIFLRGTECHTKDMEDQIAKAFGSKVIANPENGKLSYDKLRMKTHGTFGIWRHHISTVSTPWSKANALSKHLALEQVEAARLGHDIPKYIVASHRHEPGRYIDATGACIVLHPWQGSTRYAHKVVPHANCVVGVTLLDWSNREEGEIPDIRTKDILPPNPELVQF